MSALFNSTYFVSCVFIDLVLFVISQLITRGQSSFLDQWKIESMMTSSPSSLISLAPVSRVSVWTSGYIPVVTSETNTKRRWNFAHITKTIKSFLWCCNEHWHISLKWWYALSYTFQYIFTGSWCLALHQTERTEQKDRHPMNFYHTCHKVTCLIGSLKIKAIYYYTCQSPSNKMCTKMNLVWRYIYTCC